MRGACLIAGLTALLAACATAPTTSPSIAEPSASAAPEFGSLPAGCRLVDLRSPAGERIDLTGEWAGSGVLTRAGETAWLKQIGDCVYGSVVGGDYLGAEWTITNLSGRLGSNFTIDFEIVIVSQPEMFAFGAHSTMEMVIEWDAEGRISLSEAREPGEVAGRCSQPTFDCPDPVIWYRVGDSPPS